MLFNSPRTHATAKLPALHSAPCPTSSLPFPFPTRTSQAAVLQDTCCRSANGPSSLGPPAAASQPPQPPQPPTYTFDRTERLANSLTRLVATVESINGLQHGMQVALFAGMLAMHLGPMTPMQTGLVFRSLAGTRVHACFGSCAALRTVGGKDRFAHSTQRSAVARGGCIST